MRAGLGRLGLELSGLSSLTEVLNSSEQDRGRRSGADKPELGLPHALTGNCRDAVPRSGKFWILYKRPGQRTLINQVSKILDVTERNVVKRGPANFLVRAVLLCDKLHIPGCLGRVLEGLYNDVARQVGDMRVRPAVLEVSILTSELPAFAALDLNPLEPPTPDTIWKLLFTEPC